MNEVRLGVIGCGAMAQFHMKYFRDLPRLRFTAASDVVPEASARIAREHGIKAFPTGQALIESGEVDAVLIATPHYCHPEYAIHAMKNGLHTLVEKPVAVTAKAAQEMNDCHKKHPKLVYAAMFQQRLIPAFRKVRQIIKDGELGEIHRVAWTITNWFRSQAYFGSSGWRATWAGEGGGVLLNQCPHNLDMLQWLVGMPLKTHAFIGLGKRHVLEVEDEVTAYMEWANGATGVFITSTGEAPGSNRLEIVGDRGRIVTDSSAILEFVKTDVSVTEYSRTTSESFPKVPASKMTIEVDNTNEAHKGVMRNFVEAILDGKELVARGEEGINSLELANGMIMSGLTGKAVTFPTNREAYDKMLKKLVKNSKFKKPIPRSLPGKAAHDMGASFKA